MPSKLEKPLFSKKFHLFLNETHSEMSLEQIKETFYRHYNYSSFLVTKPRYYEETYVSIYRLTRPFENMNLENYRDYSYTPKSITRKGRANIDGHPIFYGSSSFLTTIQEMKGKLELNSTYYISKWNLRMDKISAIPWIMNHITMKKNNPFVKLSQRINYKSKNLLVKFGTDTEELINDIGNLFSHRGDQYYYITGALSHIFLTTYSQKLDNPTILLFPSVERNQEDLNFAIPPKVADDPDIFSLESVYEVKIIENNILTNNKAKYKLTRKATFVNNIFQNWSSSKFTLNKVHFNQLEYKLYNGQVIKGSATSKYLKETLIPTHDIVEDLIKQQIDKYGLPKDIVFAKTESLIETGTVSQFIIIVKLEHGYLFPDNKSFSCIQYIQVPIDIELNFKIV